MVQATAPDLASASSRGLRWFSGIDIPKARDAISESACGSDSNRGLGFLFFRLLCGSSSSEAGLKRRGCLVVQVRRFEAHEESDDEALVHSVVQGRPYADQTRRLPEDVAHLPGRPKSCTLRGHYLRSRVAVGVVCILSRSRATSSCVGHTEEPGKLRARPMKMGDRKSRREREHLYRPSNFLSNLPLWVKVCCVLAGPRSLSLRQGPRDGREAFMECHRVVALLYPPCVQLDADVGLQVSFSQRRLRGVLGDLGLEAFVQINQLRKQHRFHLWDNALVVFLKESAWSPELLELRRLLHDEAHGEALEADEGVLEAKDPG
mmetsp:Transcript_54060/g.115444  ORF Transcript_54060/g.115444 Transcript_54060/m.115444 type:complete len:320 (+) Transcript_54060:182-1141(+)